MITTLTTQNKGRSASFVAFWDTDSGIPTEAPPPPLLFCTYRVAGEFSQFSLTRIVHAELNGDAQVHSVRTELSSPTPYQHLQAGQLLYAQKTSTWTAPQPPIASTVFCRPQTAPTEGAIQVCTYRTPFNPSAQPRDITEIVAHPTATSRTLASWASNSNVAIRRPKNKSAQPLSSPSNAQGDSLIGASDWVASVRTDVEWRASARPGPEASFDLEIWPCSGGNDGGSLVISNSSAFDSTVAIEKPYLSRQPQGQCNGTRADTNAKLLRAASAVESNDMSAPSMKALACTPSTIDSTPHLYVQIVHGAVATSMHTGDGRRVKIIAMPTPLYVQKGSGSTKDSVRTDRSHSLNTNAHWQAILHSTVGIVISDTERDQCPLQRKHRFSNSMTRTANPNPGTRGVRHICGSGIGRLNMT